MISIERKQFEPINNNSINKANINTEIEITAPDNFISPSGIYLYLYGNYVHKEDGKSYGASSNVKLNPNAIFSRIIVKFCGTTIEEIAYVGQTIAMQEVIDPKIKSYNKEIHKGGGIFEIYTPLSKFCKFFNDTKQYIFNPNITIEFTRNYDDDILYRWGETGKDLPLEGKVVITEMYVTVPVVMLENKIKYIEHISDNPYKFVFNSWETVQLKGISGNSLNKTLTDRFHGSNHPNFGLVAFQRDRSDNQLTDNTKFDNSKVKRVWFEINRKNYPSKEYSIDFDKNKFRFAYNALKDFIKVTNPSQLLHLDYTDENSFKNELAIFVVDMSCFEEEISKSKISVVLNVEFNSHIDPPEPGKEGLVCYVSLFSPKLYKYNVVQRNVKEITA